ncbi:MAG TPA: hypothetical protein VJB16_06445 [archaeon]|nr:hypothetical protein [archaeon]
MRFLAGVSILFTLLLAGSALAAFGGSTPSAGADASVSADADAAAPSAPLTTTRGSPAAEIPRPAARARMFAAMQVMAEAQLKAVPGATMRERVAARLKDRTLTVANTVPEECRALEAEDRAECRRRYAAIQTCYDNTDAVPCLKTKLAIKATVKATLADCESKGEERASCVADIRENVYSLVKARFYAAEERAERFAEKWSLDEGLLADFIADMEQLKIDFNAAVDIAAKKGVVKQAQARWHEFVREAVKAKLAAQAEATA